MESSRPGDENASRGKENNGMHKTVKTYPLTGFALTGPSRSSRELLLSALKDVLEDDSFKTSSSVAKNARQTAASLLEWCEKVENKGGDYSTERNGMMD